MGNLIDVIKQFWVADPVEEIQKKEIDETTDKEMEKANKRIQKLEREMNFEHIKVATKNSKIKKATIEAEKQNEKAKGDKSNSEKQNEKGKDNELTL